MSKSTHVLVPTEVMKKAQLPQAPFRQNLRMSSAAGSEVPQNRFHRQSVRLTFFVNTLVTFFTAHVSPVC